MAARPQDHKPKAGKKAIQPRTLVEIVTTDEVEEDEGIPVFSLDGTVFTMPTVVSASVSLQALHMARTEGQEAAMSWVMEEVLGTEAYDTLRTCKALTGPQLTAIMEAVEEHVLGQVEEATGK